MPCDRNNRFVFPFIEVRLVDEKSIHVLPSTTPTTLDHHFRTSTEVASFRTAIVFVKVARFPRYRASFIRTPFELLSQR